MLKDISSKNGLKAYISSKQYLHTMTKDKIPLVSEKEYRKAKAICNKYERTWRNKHPKEHKENSKELLTAIVKNRQPTKKKIAKKTKVESIKESTSEQTA